MEVKPTDRDVWLWQSGIKDLKKDWRGSGDVSRVYEEATPKSFEAQTGMTDQEAAKPKKVGSLARDFQAFCEWHSEVGSIDGLLSIDKPHERKFGEDRAIAES